MKVIKILNEILTGLVEVFCMIALTLVGFFFYDTYMVNRDALNTASGYRPYIDEQGRLSLSELQALNPDVIGWITIDDTLIDYPILQNSDEITYLNHDFLRNSSLSGSLYIDKNADRNFDNDYTIVYGHHIAGGVMLGSLDYFEDTDFFNAHLTGTLVATDQVYDVTVLAFATTDAYNDLLYINNDFNSLNEALTDGSVNLEIGTQEQIDAYDKILIFSTCSSTGDSGRTLLITGLTER